MIDWEKLDEMAKEVNKAVIKQDKETENLISERTETVKEKFDRAVSEINELARKVPMILFATKIYLPTGCKSDRGITHYWDIMFAEKKAKFSLAYAFDCYNVSLEEIPKHEPELYEYIALEWDCIKDDVESRLGNAVIKEIKEITKKSNEKNKLAREALERAR